jgi:hypothetical protein
MDHEVKESDAVSPTIEELGQSYGEITSRIEELLERRETIRQQLEMKITQARDMHDAISTKFSERTGIARPGAVEIRRGSL